MRIETARKILKSSKFAKDVAEKRKIDIKCIKLEARSVLNSMERRREKLENHKMEVQ